MRVNRMCSVIAILQKLNIFTAFAFTSFFSFCHTTNAENARNEHISELGNNIKSEVNTRNGIVGAFVFPHGGITLDPETRDYSRESASVNSTKDNSLKLNKAMKKSAEDLVKTKPDLIIFCTPHGLLLQNHFLLVGNREAEGSFQDGKYSASFNLDLLSSVILYQGLLNLSSPVELLTLGVGYDTMPIRWAEVIPWIFLKEAADKETFKLPPVVLIGVPSEKIIPRYLQFGKDVFNVIENSRILSRKRIAVVISGDLSHYHSTALSSPYPYSKSSAVFDNYCVEWAKLDRNRELEERSTDILIRQAGEIVESAGSCGYNGFVILHGILSEAVKNGTEYHSDFLEYQAPSYFGMMVANWAPK